MITSRRSRAFLIAAILATVVFFLFSTSKVDPVQRQRLQQQEQAKQAHEQVKQQQQNNGDIDEIKEKVMMGNANNKAQQVNNKPNAQGGKLL